MIFEDALNGIWDKIVGVKFSYELVVFQTIEDNYQIVNLPENKRKKRGKLSYEMRTKVCRKLRKQKEKKTERLLKRE